MPKFVLIFILTELVLYSIQLENFREFKNSIVSIENDQVNLTVKQNSVKFFAIGDFGGMPVYPYRTFIQHRVSEQMDYLAQLHDTHFQLALGDNFYFTGVKNVQDSRFKDTFEDAYSSEHLTNTPWFVILGNHDHDGNPDAQLEYTQISKRWLYLILPSYMYSINVKTDNGLNDLIKILMIDTVKICGNTATDILKGFKLDGRTKFLSENESILADAYLETLENTIREIGESDIPYFLVGGHFPVWSISDHGSTNCLVEKLRPLLHKYKVSAYFCGHDHNLQHISEDYLNQTVEYFVSGAANLNSMSIKNKPSIPNNSLKFEWTKGHFVIYGGLALIEANQKQMNIKFVRSKNSNWGGKHGKILYETVVYPRNSN